MLFKVEIPILKDLVQRPDGTETRSYIAPNIWSLVPETIKNCDSLKSFKQKVRNCKPDCPGRLSKVCLQHVVVDVYWLFIS